MKTEKGKMLAGDLYNESDAELQADRARCVAALEAFNAARFQSAQWYSSLNALLGGIGTDSVIRGPITCDYGKNVYIGDRTFINYDCILMDCAEIYIGDDVLIGPRSQLITGLHPLDMKARASGLESAAPVRIENNAWLASSVIVLPGITIGEGAVVGAGSVVTKDVPPKVLAAGNPCRVIREI
ncbi:sugar O-acetyltransferase [Mycolicibacterium mengxianglii]|uniref:sugar O-acetyltransferase n=1 Tax=Mycolicibacterium mengxianglii TaxID=2736649 RepID=UPI001E3D801E|nr:sugar O-acetyltransferase [Mycolicibacterium mengxianglii]